MQPAQHPHVPWVAYSACPCHIAPCRRCPFALADSKRRKASPSALATKRSYAKTARATGLAYPETDGKTRRYGPLDSPKRRRCVAFTGFPCRGRASGARPTLRRPGRSRSKRGGAGDRPPPARGGLDKCLAEKRSRRALWREDVPVPEIGINDAFAYLSIALPRERCRGTGSHAMCRRSGERLGQRPI